MSAPHAGEFFGRVLADNAICMPWYKYTTISLFTKINSSQDVVERRGRNIPGETCFIGRILLLDLTEVFPYLPPSPSIPDLTVYISDVEIP